MKCNVRKDVTSNGLLDCDIDCITEGLCLLEKDINDFVARGDFSKISLENAQMNLNCIASVRKQLENPRQSLDLNELKVIYIGLNFLRDDLNLPAEKRSEPNRNLTSTQVMKIAADVRAAHQKITAVFTRMGVDIMASLRGF